PSCRRSRVSSSSETSHPPLGSPPHKRRRVLIYSSSSASLSPSPSVEPSRNRCRSPTLPLPLPATAEGVHAETTAKARLTHHGELIGEMYDHLLEIPLTRLETTKHELEALRARVVSSKLEYAMFRIQQGELARVATEFASGGLSSVLACIQ
ncbi:hypothetical protein Tco_0055531, partial [Tanacetum coccineum]